MNRVIPHLVIVVVMILAVASPYSLSVNLHYSGSAAGFENPVTSRLPSFVAGFPIHLDSAETSSPSFATEIGETMDHLATIDVNVVVLSLPVTPGSGFASESQVAPDPAGTPSDTSLHIAIQAAQAREIAVMLHPQADLSRKGVSASPPPRTDTADTGAWFGDYSTSLLRYAHIAQEEHAAGFIVDVGTGGLPIQDSDWTDLIDSLRDAYAGNLIYALNSYSGTPAFARMFDTVMLDLDEPAVSDMATVEQTIRDLAASTNLPIMISAFDDGPSRAATPPDEGAYRSLCTLISTAETSKSGAAILSAPESFAPPLLTLQPGSPLILTGLPTVFADISWQPVRDEATGYTGFTRTEELAGRPILAGSVIGSDQLRPDATGRNASGTVALATCYAGRLGLPGPASGG